MELEGKVALVTGGGRRLGKGISRALAEAGCLVVIHYGRSREAAEETVAEFAEAGCRASSLGADLADVDQIATLFGEIEKRFGRLDILVNSAASFEKGPLTELTSAAWDRVMAVNLRAPFVCTRYAAGLMRGEERSAGQSAAIINIADLSGMSAWPGYAHHGTSKAGLLHLTQVAARELAPDIRVNAVVPGPILPPPGADDSDEDWRRVVSRTPLARSGRTMEVGDAVRFLAANDFITGEVLRVDGGEHLIGAGHRGL